MIAISKLLKKQREATADIFGQLETLRDRITILVDERVTVENWPQPFDEAVTSLDAWLQSIGFGQTVNIAGFTTGSFSDHPVISDRAAGLMAMGLLVAASRDRVRAVLVDELRAFYADRQSGTRAEKIARLREIDGELLVLEREEERIVREAEAAGIPVLRRENASPQIVLSYDDDL